MTPHFRVPILNDQWGVRVAWGDVPTLNAALKKWGYGDEPLDADFWDARHGGCVNAPHHEPVICLPAPPSLDPVQLGTVTHEAFHAVNHILRTIEVESADEEILAHSIGAVVRTFAKKAKQ